MVGVESADAYLSAFVRTDLRSVFIMYLRALSTQPGRKGKTPSTGVTPLCDGGCQNNGHRERHHVPSFSHEDLDECTVLVAFLSMTLFGCISFAIFGHYIISFQFR